MAGISCLPLSPSPPPPSSLPGIMIGPAHVWSHLFLQSSLLRVGGARLRNPAEQLRPWGLLKTVYTTTLHSHPKSIFSLFPSFTPLFYIFGLVPSVFLLCACSFSSIPSLILLYLPEISLNLFILFPNHKSSMKPFLTGPSTNISQFSKLPQCLWCLDCFYFCWLTGIWIFFN